MYNVSHIAKTYSYDSLSKIRADVHLASDFLNNAKGTLRDTNEQSTIANELDIMASIIDKLIDAIDDARLLRKAKGLE